MTLCPHKQMDKCAQQYCDFWNKTEEMCALALEVHERVALFEKLNNLMDQLSKENAVKAADNLKEYLSKVDKKLFN